MAHHLLLPEILNGLSDDRNSVRAAAATLCGVFATEAPCFVEEGDVPTFIAALFELFTAGGLHSSTSHLSLSHFGHRAVMCPLCDELLPIDLVTRC